jgi:hypothetical protein
MFDVYRFYDKSIDKIPDELRTEETYLDIIRYHRVRLRAIPVEYRTKEVCIEAVKRNIDDIPSVPKELLTEDLYLEAIKKNGLALTYVTTYTDKLCIAAAMSAQDILEHVARFTKTLCESAVKYSKRVTLNYIPSIYLTYELCLEAVKHNGENFKHVPYNFTSYEMCLTAVENRGSMLNYVPKELRTTEICNKAVKNYGGALEYVPKKVYNYQICLDAVTNYAILAFKYVPDELMTEELCIAAIKNHADTIEKVPDRFMYNPIYDAYLEATAEKSFKMPYHVKSEWFYLSLVRFGGTNIQFVSDKYVTNKMISYAIRSNGLAIMHVDKSKLSAKLCLEAIKQNGNALKYVPKAYVTEEICIAALRNMDDPDIVAYIPPELYTEEVRSLMLAFNYTTAKSYGIKTNMPRIYHFWKHFLISRDLIYFKDNLKTAKKFADIDIKFT